MSGLIIVYLVGYAATAAFHGWHNEPDSKYLWVGIGRCVAWPLVWAFTLPASFAAAAKELTQPTTTDRRK